MDISRHSGMTAGEVDLREELFRLPRFYFCGVDARPKVAPFGVLFVPPLHQNGVGLFGVGDLPIELRRAVIKPALAEPQSRIGVQFVVSVEALDLFGMTGTPNAEGAHAEFHPRFHAMGFGIDLANEIIDVHSAPIVTGHIATIFFPTRIIRKRRMFFVGIRVKIIIDVNAIHIVALHHIKNHPQRMCARGSLGRVQPLEAVVSFYQRRLRATDMVRGYRALRAFVARAIRIEPRVQFHPLPMRLPDGKRQRIPSGLRRSAHLACQIFRPWFESRNIKRITRRPHLKDHTIEPQRRRAPDECAQFLLLLGGGEVRMRGPIDVVDRGNPCAAKFALKRRDLHACDRTKRDICRRQSQCGQQKYASKA